MRRLRSFAYQLQGSMIPFNSTVMSMLKHLLRLSLYRSDVPASFSAIVPPDADGLSPCSPATTRRPPALPKSQHTGPAPCHAQPASQNRSGAAASVSCRPKSTLTLAPDRAPTASRPSACSCATCWSWSRTCVICPGSSCRSSPAAITRSSAPRRRRCAK